MAFPGQWTAGQRIGSMMWVHWFFINRWSHRWPLDTKVLLNTFYLCCRRTHVMSHKLWYESLGHRVVTKLWNYFFYFLYFPFVWPGSVSSLVGYWTHQTTDSDVGSYEIRAKAYRGSIKSVWGTARDMKKVEKQFTVCSWVQPPQFLCLSPLLNY